MTHRHACAHPKPLTPRQQEVLDVIRRYYALIGEGASTGYLARRLAMSEPRAHQHLEALHDKGWLRTDRSPAVPIL